jgi:hypothetical protein
MVKGEVKKHSILVVGDSHIRECSARGKDKLTDTFDVTGLVKLGTVINTLTTMVRGNMENLTENNAIVFWSSTNDGGQDISHDGLKY